MFTKLLCLAVALAAAQASNQFIVLHSPDSVSFKGNEEVPQSMCKEILSAALGCTTKLRGSWSGMSIKDPFNLPEAVVGVTVEGANNIAPSKGKHYPLNADEDEEITWQAVSGRLEARDSMATRVRIYLGDGVDALGQSALGELKLAPNDESKLKSLSLKNKPDCDFLDEMALLNAISKKVQSTITPDNKPDVYWFVVSAFQALRDFHGDDSPAVKEATVLLDDALTRLCNAFMDVYGGKVLVAVFTSDATNVRHTRAATAEGVSRADNVTGQSSHKTVETTTEARTGQESTEPFEVMTRVVKSSEINVSKAYDDTYPVMFNIFLWFGVAFLFSLIAVCIVIGDMDPGRDSIIYRMTSTRMKKDN